MIESLMIEIVSHAIDSSRLISIIIEIVIKSLGKMLSAWIIFRVKIRNCLSIVVRRKYQNIMHFKMYNYVLEIIF